MTGTYKVIIRGGTHAHYVPTGHLVYVAGGILRAVTFDLDRLEVTGAAVPVLDRVVATATGAAEFSIAANGSVAYIQGDPLVADPARLLVWVDREGRESSIAAPPRPYAYPRLSPDGTRIALDVASSRNRDIWVWDLMRETLTRLTSHPSFDRQPSWSPDGRKVVFSSSRTVSGSRNAASLSAATNDPDNLYWQNADGTGEVEALTQTALGHFAPTFTPDGKVLVFHELQRNAQMDIAMTTIGGDRQAVSLIRSNFNERNPQISPDGRWLAYDSDATGQFEVYVRPFPAVEQGQWQVSTAGGVQPIWAPNGEGLFYRSITGAIIGVTVQGDRTWAAGKPTEYVKPGYWAGLATGLVNTTYDVAKDGRFLAIKEPATSSSTPSSIVLVQNWFEELKRLVPTN